MSDGNYRETLITEARKFILFGSDLNPVEADRLISELCDELERTP